MSRRWPRRPRRIGITGDEGFTLVEIMAAFVVLVLMSSGVLYTLLDATGVTRADKNRVVAANLLQQRIECLRLLEQQANGVQSIPLGVTTAGTAFCPNPSAVDGVRFAITQTSTWVASNQQASACSGNTTSSQYASLRVSVTATWPGMGVVKPPRSDTLLTPGAGSTSTATGSQPVLIVDRAGSPVAGVSVTMSPTSSGATAAVTQVTDATGCALFAFEAPGTYALSSSSATLVDWQGSATHTVPSAVITVNQQNATSSWALDTPASATVTAVSDVTGWATPTSSVVEVTNRTPTPVVAVDAQTASGSASFSSLFPFAGGDLAWAGSCPDAEPAAYPLAADPVIPLTPGQSSTATAKLRAVSVTVNGSSPGPGIVVYAIHAAATGCLGATDPITGAAVGEVVTLGTTTGSGALPSSVPYGTWTFKAFRASDRHVWTSAPLAVVPLPVGAVATAVTVS